MSQSSFYPKDDDSRLMTHYSRNINAGRRGRYSSELNLPSDTARQRELIAKLEAKNREIMREIVHLRKQQEQEEEALNSERNPTLLAELRALRMRKADLERHLSGLQESRRDLMLQLDVLMRMLKDHSPMSSPNSSPFSSMRRSAPFYPLSSMSAPATPGGGSYPYIDPLYGLGGDVRLAFGQAASSRSLQNDLLLAADSVTNAMSSLVKELNLGCEDGENDYLRRCSSYIGNPQIDAEFGYDNESWSNEPDYPNDYYVLDPRDPALQENEIYNTMEPNIFPSGTAIPSSDETNFVQSDEEDNLEWNDRHWIQ
ncbi:Dystrobrevin beta, partial [Stegodyphus mimosarum]